MRTLFFSIASVCLLVDQLFKYWARSATGGVEQKSFMVVWPEVFELKLVYNDGIAFGMLQGMGVWLTPIAIVIAGGAAWYSLKHQDEPKVTHITMALLASGAVGNLIDRLMFGKVTDMFWVRAINFPVFNFADACITVAGFLLAFSVIAEFVHPPKKEEPEVEDEPEEPGSDSPPDEAEEPGPDGLPEQPEKPGPESPLEEPQQAGITDET